MRKNNLTNKGTHFSIIRYPRIIDPLNHKYPVLPNDYVEPDMLRQHLRFFKENCKLISLEELLSKVESSSPIDPDTIVLTFDHGYKDFFNEALPILKTYGVPATLFVHTTFIGTKELYWQDQVLLSFDLLRQAGLSFPKLSLFEEDFYNFLRPSATLTPITATLENALLTIIYLRAKPPFFRYAALTQFFYYIHKTIGFPDDRHFMTWEEVVSAQQQGINICTSGNNQRFYNESTDQEVMLDLTKSLQTLKTHGINSLPVIAPVDEQSLSPHCRKILKSIGVKAFLTQSTDKDPYDPKEFAYSLRRIHLDENSNNLALLACKIWDIKFWGIPLG